MPAVPSAANLSAQATSPSSSKPGSFVAPGQAGASGAQQPSRSYARSLSTLSRPTQVISRQTIPARVGDGLSQTQRTMRAQVSGTRWRSPSGARDAPGTAIKVTQARPTFSGAFGGAFSPSAPLSSGGNVTGASISGVTVAGGDADDDLSRTWRGMSAAVSPPTGTATAVAAGVQEAAPTVTTLSSSKREVLMATPATSVSTAIAKELSATSPAILLNERGRDYGLPTRTVLSTKEMPMSANPLSVTRRDVAVARAVERQEPPGTPVHEPRSMRLSLGSRPVQAGVVSGAFAPLQRTARRAQSPGIVPTARASTAPTAWERAEAVVNGRGSHSTRMSAQPVFHPGISAPQSPSSVEVRPRAGSYVAEPPARPEETRQTASFTALPMYKWTSQPLRLQTVAGAYTQGGHKTRVPGHRNQDSHLIVQLGAGVMLAAVLDGHGANGHLVSGYVCEIFERYAPHFAAVPSSELPDAFLKVFSLAQEGLEKEGLAEMAGTTATLALINANAGTITVAHVGDSTLAVFVGFTVSFRTKDHIVDDDVVRYVSARGGEVKASTFDGVTARRIYQAGEDGAGLAMSRALGHTELQPLILTVPEVSHAQFGAGCTLVVASDGIWEKMAPEAVAEIIASAPPTMSNVQAGNLARTLVTEAGRRWPTPPAGDVDDITAIVVRAVPESSGGSLTAPIANSR